jgi:hypothetical protein
MTMLQNLRPHCGFLALVAFYVLSGFPQLSAQNPKQLMTDACENELRQREQNALWASQVERRTAGHVYREREIDTVDGPVHRLLSVDGHEPSPLERKQDADRLRDLKENPKARLTLKKNREAEEKKVDDLLRVIPDIFLFQDQGKRGNLERIAFHPNPAYKPSTYEEMALHALSGVVLIDLREKRLARFSGTLSQQVNFGHGLLGHLNKGGMIEVSRVCLSPGQWGTSLFQTDFDGRFAIFKNISKHLDETRNDFEPVPPDTDIQRALEQIVRKSANLSQTTRGDIERSHESEKAFLKRVSR